MKEYPKIQSIYKRNAKTRQFISNEWSQPEFEYLAYNEWIGTEKVDGTNIRVCYFPQAIMALSRVEFYGRTDRAQIPPKLLIKLNELFPPEKFDNFPDEMYLYGEGYGAGIQKGGVNYISNGCDFVLFDVLIGDWWLRSEDIADIGLRLGVSVVPEVFRGTLFQAIDFVSGGFSSAWGNFPAEGLVLKTSMGLKDRGGKRIITKIKTRDFSK